MAQKYAKGTRAWGICGRSGRKMLLRDMVFDERYPNMRVDPDWFEGKHPQEFLPKVEDPTALYRPAVEVIDGPTAPVLTAMEVTTTQVSMTWTAAETDVSEILNYTILRGVDGAPLTTFLVCAVLRDFLGGIIGVQHCTTVPSIPHDDSGDRGGIFDIPTNRDAPVTYLDTSVTVGHTYCYAVFATPMGNNQSVAQGPPSPNSNTVCLLIQATATTVVLSGSVVNNDEVDLSWTPSTVEGSTIAHYVVFRNQDGGAFTQLAEVDGATLVYIDSTVVLGPVYGYNVVALPAVGVNSAPSNTVFEQLSVYYTSQIYPVQVIEALKNAALSIHVPTYQYAEGLAQGLLVESGTLTPGLLTYTNGLPEGLVNALLVESGTLTLGLLTYTNALPEGIVNALLVESGTLVVGLTTYTNWPAEGLKNTVQVTSGTLT